MVGGQSLVEGDVLSIPATLNATLVTKIRYQKTNGNNDDSGKNKGQIDFPDEAALFLAGRAGEHIGFLLEAQLKDGGSSNFTNFKIPIGYDVPYGMHLEVVPFTTDLGPQFSFEVLNTGAVGNIRALEHKTEISAVQYVGLKSEAQGLGFVAYHNTGYINYTVWQPNAAGTSDAFPLLNYLRVAATPTIAGWDLGAGGQWWSGTTKSAGATREKAEGWAVDAQAQGMVVNLPLGVYLSYAKADGSKAGEPANIFNSNAGDAAAWSILAELGVLPNRVTLATGYRAGDNGAVGPSEQDAITFGATFLVTQNFELQINHSSFSGDWYDVPANNENSNGDQLTTLMIFAAF